jgi:hypothetical protein
MEIDLKSIERRQAQYSLEDGTIEVFLGLMMLVPGLIYIVNYRWMHTPILASLLCIPFYLALPRVYRAVRERVVSPRGGYVAFKDPPRWRFVAMMVLGLAIIPLVWFRPPTEWFTIGAVAILAATFLYLAANVRSLKWAGYGVFVLAMVVWTYRTQPGLEGMFWILIVIGAALALGGSFQFWRFLRTHARA